MVEESLALIFPGPRQGELEKIRMRGSYRSVSNMLFLARREG